jgi:hypothetical protein
MCNLAVSQRPAQMGRRSAAPFECRPAPLCNRMRLLTSEMAAMQWRATSYVRTFIYVDHIHH